jgi:hypothetical protein
MYTYYPPRSSSYSACCSALLATCFRLISCSAYFSTLNMEATYSSETSVDFRQIARRYIPELFITTAVRTSSPAVTRNLIASFLELYRGRGSRCSGDALHLYPQGVGFRVWSRHRPSWFPQPLEAYAMVVLRLCHNDHLPNSLQFIAYPKLSEGKDKRSLVQGVPPSV